MRCQGDRKLAEASSVTFSPIVTPETLQHWLVYVTYKELSGELESNFTDGYDPHSGHDHGDNSVYYVETDRSVQDGIYKVVGGEAHSLPETLDNNTIFAPVWQRSPKPDRDIRMYDLLSNPVRARALSAILGNGVWAGAMTDLLLYDTNMTDFAYFPTPNAALYVPIHQTVDKASPVVGTLGFQFLWETFLEGILQDEAHNLMAVVENSCTTGRKYSFLVEGPNVTYLGPGDLHTDPENFTPPKPVTTTFQGFLQVFQTSDTFNTSNLDEESLPCQFRVTIYSTAEMRDSYLTNHPATYRWIVLGVFLLVVSVFLFYDCVVESRSSRVVESAKRTDALVSTLFPSSVKQRLLENADKKRKAAEERSRMSYWHSTDVRSSVSSDGLHVIQNPKHQLKSLLNPDERNLMESGDIDDTEPIADLFPSASVMFADVAGFTAWSSERDPSQVFKLLETLYRSMDKAARRFKIFKVETIGDCYVAAAGLPGTRS
jgi:Adenylate and Guanylate cyclase catalytic domain